MPGNANLPLPLTINASLLSKLKCIHDDYEDNGNQNKADSQTAEGIGKYYEAMRRVIKRTQNS